jgi:hypothetical protein
MKLNLTIMIRTNFSTSVAGKNKLLPVFHKNFRTTFLKTTIVLLILLTFQSIFAQEQRIVSGILKDKSGEPLPGVNIVVEGTVNGTVTDGNGYYRIKAPLGSTLIYSFVGYDATKVTVNRGNSKESGDTPPVELKNVPQEMKSSYSPLPGKNADTDTVKEEGTAYFTHTTPSFEITESSGWGTNIDPHYVSNVQVNNRVAKISIRGDKYIRIPHVTFMSSLAIEKPNRLPKLQNQFAQGRPESGILQWRGPDSGEIYSWGPNIQNLEFDGSVYDYDKSGRLVSTINGNGSSSKAYNPYDFFRVGTSLVNFLKIDRRDEKRSYNLVLNNRVTNGIIPDARKTSNSATMELERKWRYFSIGYNLFCEGSNSNLMRDNPSINLLMSSIMTTPPTFDNANGFTTKKAAKTPLAYQLNNGNQRSSSAGNNNNPYWLVNHLPGKETYYAFNNLITIRVHPVKNLELRVQPGFELQTCKNNIGYPLLTAGTNVYRLTERTDRLQSFRSSIGLTHEYYYNQLYLNNSLNFDYRHTNRLLQRKDLYANIEGLQVLNDSSFRSESYFSHALNLKYHELVLFSITNGFTKSNAFYKDKLLYNPYFAAGFNFHELFNRHYYRILQPINYLKLRASLGYNYSEIPFIFSMGSYNYQQCSSGQFTQAYFNFETISKYSLLPEKVLKKNIGLDLGLVRNRIVANIDYYVNKTTAVIIPVLDNSSAVLRNLANTKTKGFEVTLTYQNWLRNQWNTTVNMTFNHSRTMVTELYESRSEIQMGGFTDVHTALIKGKPYGTIVGTAYQRNENGELIIGADGYPLVDSKLKVLGDPNPDFRLGMELLISHKALTFNCLAELSKGGKRWNGTENLLSYLGMAQKTVEARKITGYIYPGVTENGMPNTTPVNFADPSLGIDANRWVKYGPSGVGEDGIQDATWFRIRELNVKYIILLLHRKLTLEISVFAKNPLLITRYTGVDPETTLWGQRNAQGLDMFNMPNLKSYGLGLKIML